MRKFLFGAVAAGVLLASGASAAMALPGQANPRGEAQACTRTPGTPAGGFVCAETAP